MFAKHSIFNLPFNIAEVVSDMPKLSQIGCKAHRRVAFSVVFSLEYVFSIHAKVHSKKSIGYTVKEKLNNRVSFGFVNGDSN